MKEYLIQQQICEHLTDCNYFFFSIPNEGIMSTLIMFRVPESTRYAIYNKFRQTGLRSGIPDLCILADNGHAYFLEIKNETGKLSDKQINIHSILEKKKIPVAVVRSLEDLRKQLNTWGI